MDKAVPARKAFFSGIRRLLATPGGYRAPGTRRGAMAGTGQGLFVGVAVLGMVALGWAARAETIPLPTPAPLPKETGSPSKSGTATQSGRSGPAPPVQSPFYLS